MLETHVKIIKHKVDLLNLAEELGHVSRACKMMGLSRDTFYRYKAAVESGGVESLFDKSRRQPNLKNRVDDLTEQAVLRHALDYPAHGQVRVSNELRKTGIIVSPSGVRCIGLRNDLANFKERLKALEAKVAEQGLILTEAQVAALEKKRQDDAFNGEIDTAHPGYLGSQNTIYVGTFKGVGRVYQQTFCRHLFESGVRQTLHHQDAIDRRRLVERQGVAILRGTATAHAAHPDRPGHGILWPGGQPRLSTLFGDQRHRAHQDQGAITADQRYL